MKTTIDIADSLLRQAKALARRDQTTLRSLMEEGLRLVLKARKRSRRRPRIRPVVVDGTTPPELFSWPETRKAIYDDYELERLRRAGDSMRGQ